MMKYKIQSFLLVLLFLCLTSGCTNSNFQTADEKENIQKIISKAQNSKFIVLDVYHNRCETCKFIEPVIEKLQKDYADNPDIVFLKYDLSNPFAIFKSRNIAKQLGLEDIYKSQRYSGVVLIIDAKTKLVVDTLIAEYNKEKYLEAINQRLHAT